LLESTVKNKVGIMCGRLSKSLNGELQAFPYHRWREEFPLYRKLGMDSVEWLFDGPTNPLFFEEGRKEIRRLCDHNNVSINSVMAQYFIDRPFFNRKKSAVEEDKKILIRLIEACFCAGIEIIEMPLLEEAEIKNKEDETQFIDIIKGCIIPFLEKHNVILSFEAPFAPSAFAEFLQAFNHPLIKATFDMGNSAFLSADSFEEIEILTPWLVNVHIKDKNLEGANVSLGHGIVNFERVFNELKKNRYAGDYILETNKGDQNDSDQQRQSRIEEYLRFLNPFLGKIGRD
jgi:L-ribulose-5-phosphate 3-epimerase